MRYVLLLCILFVGHLTGKHNQKNHGRRGGSLKRQAGKGRRIVASKQEKGFDKTLTSDGKIPADVLSNPDLLWRVHWRTNQWDEPLAPFSPENARSYNAADEEAGPEEGYSAFADPKELLRYFNSWRHSTPDDDERILAFTGSRVGTGPDGEPLVVPDMEEIHEYTFGALVKSLPEEKPEPKKKKLSPLQQYLKQKAEGNL